MPCSRRVAAIPSGSNGLLSPSVMSTTARRRTLSGKKPCVPSAVSASNVVATMFTSRGGGASTAIELAAESNAARSEVGKSAGRTRSVKVPTPTGMSPRRAASSTAFRFASVRRVGPPGLAAAAIDREVSRTTSACASVRARSDVRVRSAGCVAASARRPMTAVITSRRRRLRIGVAGRPRTRRARATRRSPSASAASGRATRTMSTAPSGVKKVREIVAVNIPARESRHPRRSARSRAAGRRSSARGEHRGPRPRAARLRG